MFSVKLRIMMEQLGSLSFSPNDIYLSYYMNVATVYCTDGNVIQGFIQRGEGGGGGGHWDSPPPPQNFKNCDVIITMILVPIYSYKVKKCSDSEHKC